MKILVIDNNKLYLSLIRKRLKKICDKVDTVNNSIDALKLIIKTKYNLIILDLLMPDLNGLQLYDELKKVDKEVNIIINTADTNLDNKKDAIVKGVFAYYSKNSFEMLYNEVGILNNQK